jgi:hypothetical protein
MQLRISTYSQQVKKLDQERSWIQRQFLDLDEAILLGKGSPRILDAARTLVPYMLLHFTHQEQFQKLIPSAASVEQKLRWKQHMAELMQIDAGLVQGEVYAALQLRGFCRAWMHEGGAAEEVDFPLTARPHSSPRKTAQA